LPPQPDRPFGGGLRRVRRTASPSGAQSRLHERHAAGRSETLYFPHRLRAGRADGVDRRGAVAMRSRFGPYSGWLMKFLPIALPTARPSSLTSRLASFVWIVHWTVTSQAIV